MVSARRHTQSVPKEESEAAGEDAEERLEFTRDEVLKILSNQRRRFVLHFLKRQKRENVSLRDLSAQVASWEYDKPVDQLSYKERKRVQNALRQYHLPKLANYGFVEYDHQRKTVELTDAAAKQDFYLDVVPERDIPWSLYYAGLAALGAISLIGVWAGAWPLSALDPLLWSVFFVTTMGASSVVHLYDSHYRMRLGARRRPPEVG